MQLAYGKCGKHHPTLSHCQNKTLLSQMRPKNYFRMRNHLLLTTEEQKFCEHFTTKWATEEYGSPPRNHRQQGHGVKRSPNKLQFQRAATKLGVATRSKGQGRGTKRRRYLFVLVDEEEANSCGVLTPI